ncbi:phosphotransferase [Streptomyces sp. 3MP-14]|uniref:Phosphotransferase n=1 Tax=Streptomyces mimosae TaxID=2586635 RepID=A0A5N6A9K3_9ACTN|nr:MULTISPECIES: aminoglycoside phosphotransferase family protein [Streptomyces]KAB8164178.1 phosphotransferase [Streptomyces mimosae]KAB8176455.1 phosphotransferase [Streptomyces sp. 3MP-14]
MGTRLRDRALKALGVVSDGGSDSLESRSGASVGSVRRADGERAFLKVVPASAGAMSLANARNELRFYRELAPVVPVRVPRLIDGWEDGDGVVLLLTHAGKPREAASWTPELWAMLGRDLAALHTMPPPAAAGWERRDPLSAALDAPDLPGIREFWGDALPQLAVLLSSAAEFRRRMEVPPPVFRHGDFHTDNIVHRGASLVFCDWQSTGVGRPSTDLAFLSVRMTPGGTVVPRAFVDAYLAHRPVAVGDRAVWEQALVAEELATLLWLWPPFAAYNDAEGIARVRHRARALADRFLYPKE